MAQVWWRDMGVGAQVGCHMRMVRWARGLVAAREWPRNVRWGVRVWLRTCAVEELTLAPRGCWSDGVVDGCCSGVVDGCFNRLAKWWKTWEKWSTLSSRMRMITEVAFGHEWVALTNSKGGTGGCNRLLIHVLLEDGHLVGAIVMDGSIGRFGTWSPKNVRVVGSSQPMFM